MTQKKFTLIELLVVVAIIAILASILMPALQQARARGRSANCINNLKTISSAYQSYSQDNNDYFPQWGYKNFWLKGHKDYKVMPVTAPVINPLLKYLLGSGSRDSSGAGSKRLARSLERITVCIDMQDIYNPLEEVDGKANSSSYAGTNYYCSSVMVNTPGKKRRSPKYGTQKSPSEARLHSDWVVRKNKPPVTHPGGNETTPVMNCNFVDGSARSVRLNNNLSEDQEGSDFRYGDYGWEAAVDTSVSTHQRKAWGN
ncbi:MAG: type II secretion system protein [Lentisphaeria bacterium]|nr:type II secretion system protein [Lentisphaeria bacterium]